MSVAVRSYLTAYRQALSELLEKHLDIPFVHGMLAESVEGSWLGCTYPGRVEEVSEDLNVEIVVVYVRVYQPLATKRSVKAPVDPSDLEAAAAKIQEVLVTHQIGLGPWAQRVQRIEFNMRQQYIEATIHAMQDNRSINVGQF